MKMINASKRTLDLLVVVHALKVKESHRVGMRSYSSISIRAEFPKGSEMYELAPCRNKQVELTV